MIKFQMKQLFFDKMAVLSSVDKASRQVLSKIGAFVRQTARQSIRRPPKTKGSTWQYIKTASGRRIYYKQRASAKPGKPPYNQSGLLKRFIFFGYDPAANSVVVGPEKLGGRISETALPALEYGGESTAKEFKYHGGNSRRTKTYRKVHIRPHPFMGPALDKEKEKLPALWLDSVHN